MDPTMHLIARSVQRAVMSAPGTTVAEAAEAARRAARSLATPGADIPRLALAPRPTSASA